jgi:hypothetical protein
MEILARNAKGTNHKSGVINSKQVSVQNATTFTVNKIGKKIDDYYVTKALQLYLEGLSYRNRTHNRSPMSPSAMGEIVQHQKPSHANYHPPRFSTI